VEVEEAFQAGSEAFDVVSRTESFLRQAQGWGQRDMWGGIHQGSGYMKHQAIDQARNCASQSRHALIHFSNELKDVFQNLELKTNMDIDEFNKFGDLFFDNIISDYYAQQKINKALTNVTWTRGQVEQILHQLEEEKGNVKSRFDQLEQQRKDIIVKA
jgi:hypothetical protein